MTDSLSDLRRADAHARWCSADALALRSDAATQLADAPVHLAGYMDDEDDRDAGYEVLGGVAVVPIEGALLDRACWCWDGYDKITARIEAAHADARVRSVMLDLDSPGGMVSGLFDAMRALRAAKVKSGKRCVAWVGSGAYSAAYGLASTCDEIVCSDTAGTGSVGVIAALVSRVDQLAQDGVDVRVVSSGTEKTDGHPAVAISEGATTRITARVRELAAMLFSEVGATRPGLTPEALTALDGGVRYGRAALAAGLVDRISTRSTLLAEMQSSAAPSLRPANRTPGARSAATSRGSTMLNDTTLAALAAATGESDPDKAVASLLELHAAAPKREQDLATARAAIESLSADVAAANDRARAAEARIEGIERDAEIEGMKAEGKWSPALDGFLGTLGVEQLRSYRASAPRVVPSGEVPPPPPSPAAGNLSADLGALVAKARDTGWQSLSAAEKHVLSASAPDIAAELRDIAAPKTPRKRTR